MKTRWGVMAAVGLLALLVSGCAATGVYPRDLMSEMHYQPSYRAQEPPRLETAEGAVPVTGRELELGSFQDAAKLENPVPSNEATLRRGARLFSVNCAQCHGAEGRGGSRIGELFARAGSPPADLTGQRVKDMPPGQVFYIVTKGQGNMPPFGKLLTAEERWMVVHFIRAVSGQ